MCYYGNYCRVKDLKQEETPIEEIPLEEVVTEVGNPN
jgi:hypothetical protein